MSTPDASGIPEVLRASRHIKPIETKYKGYRFRSRLEARWAVYFDAMGFDWEYEKEGYDLGEAGWYLPDFWLPQVNMWAEVKSKDLTKDEFLKAVMLCEMTRRKVLLLIGVPAKKTYLGISDITKIKCTRCGKLQYLYECPTIICRECGSTDFKLNWCEDFLLTNYHDYVVVEDRFYSNTEYNGENRSFEDSPYDNESVERAINAARGARFEHGETPA